MHILVCNDDGVHAPGINCLAKWLSKIAQVTVVAPDRNRSAASHSLTLHEPLRVTTLENGYQAVSGTPTDCVHIALAGGLEIEPDMVISGINEGGNLGDDVMYSGTVAAAAEGRTLGRAAIAISLTSADNQYLHYDSAGEFLVHFLAYMKRSPLPSDTILNINVPDIPYKELKGVKICRLGSRHMAEKVVKAQDPHGKDIYWVGPPGPEADAGPDTDFAAVANGYVAVTPLKLDMTNTEYCASMKEWVGDYKIMEAISK